MHHEEGRIDWGNFPMKKLICAVIASLGLIGCASMKYGSTSLGQAFHGEKKIAYDWGEVYCGEGTVCAEVEVLRVDFENRDDGRVEVTLHNRTGSQVAVQISLEILADNGSRLDSSGWQDVPLQPRQETVYDLPGVYKRGGKIRVMLRTR
jgi:hypothetical protein